MNDSHDRRTRSVFSGVLLALIVFFVGLPIAGVTLCVAIGHSHDDSSARPSVAALPSAAPSAAATPSAAPSTGPIPPFYASVALFNEREELAVCADRDITARVLEAGAPTEQSVAAVRQTFAEREGDSSVATMLNKECGKAFSDRLVLAKCVTPAMALTYYSFDLLQDDRTMRQCIKNGGTWTSLPRDSDEYKLAKSEWDVAKATRDLKKLQGH